MELLPQQLMPRITVSGSYHYAWKQLGKYFLLFFVIALLLSIADAPTSVGKDADKDVGPYWVMLQMVVVAYWFLILPVFNYGGDLLYLQGVRNEKMDLTTLLSGFRENYLSIILTHLLCFTLIGIGFIFLIIPGIILACRLVFVSYLVMDKRLEPVAAIEKSWAMTRGHGWKIFWMAMLGILIFIAGIICFIVGAFISYMWIKAAFASLYYAIDLQEHAQVTYGPKSGAPI